MQTCETCKHYVRGEINPSNLAAPRMGQCRESLHIVAIPSQGMAGQVMIQLTPVYAQLPENFPACGRHQQAEGK